MIAAIIQARLNAKRLPNKVMKSINGKPMLCHVINRTRVAVDNVIVATPDEKIAKYAKKQGVLSFVGSENDVLDRYYQAAKTFNVSDIIRITADNPLVDPDIIKEVVKLYFEADADYACNNMPRTYPMGLDVEVFSFESLERAWASATLPEEKEHVTPYIRNHPEIFKLVNLGNDTDLSQLRWTVDYQEDLDFARKVYFKLGDKFTMQEVLCVNERK